MAKPKKRERERLDEPKALPAPDKGVEISTPEKYGARPSKAHTCKSCGHSYLKPCNDDEKRKAKCGNWGFILQQQAANKAKKK